MFVSINRIGFKSIGDFLPPFNLAGISRSPHFLKVTSKDIFRALLAVAKTGDKSPNVPLSNNTAIYFLIILPRGPVDGTT